MQNEDINATLKISPNELMGLNLLKNLILGDIKAIIEFYEPIQLQISENEFEYFVNLKKCADLLES